MSNGFEKINQATNKNQRNDGDNKQNCNYDLLFHLIICTNRSFPLTRQLYHSIKEGGPAALSGKNGASSIGTVLT